MQATQTLPEAAKDTIRREFDRAESDDPTVLWWDDGNYLEDIVEQACAELGVGLNIADETSLELRADPRGWRAGMARATRQRPGRQRGRLRLVP